MKLFTSIALVLFLFSNSFSQSPENSDKKLLLSGGVGAGFSENAMSLPTQINLGLASHDILYFTRISYQNEFLGLSASPNESFMEAGFLIGRYLQKSPFLFSVSGGIGIVSGSKRDQLLYKSSGIFSTEYYSESKFVTFGIPLEARIDFNPISRLGIGLSANANLNPEYSVFGVAILLSLL